MGCSITTKICHINQISYDKEEKEIIKIKEKIKIKDKEKIKEKPGFKNRFNSNESKCSVSPSVAGDVCDMTVDIPDPFKLSYRVIECIYHGHYRKLYCALSKEKKEVIIELTELKGFYASGQTEIDYYVRLDQFRQFDHPSIPKVLDFFDGKDIHRIVFEMASGKDLEYILKAKGPPKSIVIESDSIIISPLI